MRALLFLLLFLLLLRALLLGALLLRALLLSVVVVVVEGSVVPLWWRLAALGWLLWLLLLLWG